MLKRLFALIVVLVGGLVLTVALWPTSTPATGAGDPHAPQYDGGQVTFYTLTQQHTATSP